VRRQLGRIESNGRHLLTIINEILDISRIEAGKMPLTVAEFTIPGLLREVLAEVEPLIARSRLTVSTELAEKLPTMGSDRQKVKQIVINLLTNALKFTPQGWVKVAATWDAGSEQVAIAVTDSGIGLSAAEMLKTAPSEQRYRRLGPLAAG
jgi:signal transduction histidine kinase